MSYDRLLPIPTQMEYRLGLYEKSMPNELSLREKLYETKNAGFDYLELSIDETEAKLARLDWDMQQISELRADICDTGIPIHSICLSGHRKYPMGHPDPACRQRSMQIMRQAIRLASDLGVRVIQLAGYDVYYEKSTEESRALFVENLSLAAWMAAKDGMTIAFETMETPFLNTVAKAMAYVAQINNAWLQIYPDIGNLTNASAGQTPQVINDLETGKGHIVAVHLKETKPDVFREVPYGTGHVDFVKLAQKALQMGVRTFVGEFWYNGNENWRQELCDANVFLRSKLAEAINE